MSQSKTRLLELNARLAQNLTDKGIEATAEETTTALVDKVTEIPSVKEEQEKTVDITENGTYDVLADENKALSKVTVNVDVADSYYDTFWDAYQQNGERTNYEKAFFGAFWNNDNFKPKYDLIIEGSGMSVFQYNLISGDFAQLLKDYNVTLDTSKCTSLFATFQGVRMTKVPHISCEGSNGANSLFYNANLLETIEKLTVHANLDYTQAFNICRALKNIVIEGEIGSTFDIKWSPLTVASAISIITHLVNYAGTENEFVHSVLFADSVWELLNAEGSTAPGDITWEEYVNSIGWNK